ncbi:MAG: hypothetical protein M3151_14255 [Actinomycetota bacterium]|nr:hypothetical protein [Actinomycetota bacterium]
MRGNTRRRNGTPFLEAYERFLNTLGTDYGSVKREPRWGEPEQIRAFFRPIDVHAATFDNRQVFDLEGLRGRLLSSSYVPAVGEPAYPAMPREIESIFREHR